jgi:hypothetical protein
MFSPPFLHTCETLFFAKLAALWRDVFVFCGVRERLLKVYYLINSKGILVHGSRRNVAVHS